jgi:hypothetical protein
MRSCEVLCDAKLILINLSFVTKLTYLQKNMVAPIYAKMARKQLRLMFFGGLALVPALSVVAAVSMHHATPANAWAKAGDLIESATGMCFSIAGVGALPAFLAGLLRLWPMARIFEALRGRGILDWVLVLGGTLLLFEATVLLGALLLHLVDYRIEYRVLWNICTGFSLPWHLASLWASWRVLRAAHSNTQPH